MEGMFLGAAPAASGHPFARVGVEANAWVWLPQLHPDASGGWAVFPIANIRQTIITKGKTRPSLQGH